MCDWIESRVPSKLISQRFSRVDTISSSCKESNLAFKLDIRIISEKDILEVDVMNEEVASVSQSNRGKHYKDALKLALSAKQHLNTSMSSLNPTPKELIAIKLPIVQIMGLNCHISCINIVDRNVYVLQEIDMAFPNGNERYTTSIPLQSFITFEGDNLTRFQNRIIRLSSFLRRVT